MYAFNAQVQQSAAARVDSFDWLYRKYFSVLVLFARKFLRDRSAAEDIVSDVFYKLWAKATRFESEAAARSFLYISTRNACINSLARQSREQAAMGRLGYEARKEAPGMVLNDIIRLEVMRQVLHCLDQLPPGCRKVMRMSFVQGLSNREIANMLRLSINTVRNQRTRGIHLIRKRRGYWA